MPYTVDTRQPIWRITLSGTFTHDELIALARDAERIEIVSHTIPHRLTNIQPTTRLELTFRSMLEFVQERLRMRFPNTFKSAVIANDVVHYGFARMFETLNDHPQIVIAIFSNESEALRWLNEPGVERYARPSARGTSAN
jgi:hypothetical protein